MDKTSKINEGRKEVMENRNNDEFELNFDDDVVDMTGTGPGPGQGIGTYGTYGNSQYNNNDDIYGVYQPGRTYETRAEAMDAKRAEKLKGREKTEKVVNVLYYIALWSEVAFFAYFLITKNYDLNLFSSLSGFVSLFFEVVIIVDACLMHSRYKKMSLLVTGLAFPVFYPFCRNSAKGESKSLSALWLVASIVVLVFFVKNAAIPMALSSRGRDMYDSKYETEMQKFKDYKYDGSTRTEEVVQVWFDEYKLNVQKEDTDSIYVELSGQTNTEIQGVVKSDQNINPNTEIVFKVKKEDGSYGINSLKINNKLYNQYKDNLWQYWYKNYKSALPW